MESVWLTQTGDLDQDLVRMKIPAKSPLFGRGLLWCPFKGCHSCVLSPLSRAQLFETPWTAARQAPLSMTSSRQECWSGLPCPPSGDLPNPGSRTASLMSPALAGGLFTSGTTWDTPFKGCSAPNDVIYYHAAVHGVTKSQTRLSDWMMMMMYNE